MNKSILLAALFAAAPVSLVGCSAGGNYDEPEMSNHEAGGGEDVEQKDIVDTAVAAGSFKTLASLLTEAGLVETLKGEGPFTVFAPTDEAFAKLPTSAVEGLKADKEKLKSVLLYHVVSGKVDSKAVTGLSSAKTVNGSEVPIVVKDGSVHVAGAKVTTADVGASNGIIHIIDTVMLPPAN